MRPISTQRCCGPAFWLTPDPEWSQMPPSCCPTDRHCLSPLIVAGRPSWSIHWNWNSNSNWNWNWRWRHWKRSNNFVTARCGECRRVGDGGGDAGSDQQVAHQRPAKGQATGGDAILHSDALCTVKSKTIMKQKTKCHSRRRCQTFQSNAMFNIRAPAHETSGINIKCSILGIYVNGIFFLEEKSNGSFFNRFQNYKK